MKKKLLVTAMAAMPMLGMFGGNFASAAVVSTDQIDRPENSSYTATEDVLVKVTQQSTFSVVIPKEIVLEEVTSPVYEEDYTVVVKGDIAGNETVTVTPDGTVDLLQSGKANIKATVDQKVTTATSAELANNAQKSLDGTVTATDVTAGSWQGTFMFDISKN